MAGFDFGRWKQQDEDDDDDDVRSKAPLLMDRLILSIDFTDILSQQY